jgi:predicted O-linked N-acetylglucosamine transferase (SPINDLY family)
VARSRAGDAEVHTALGRLLGRQRRFAEAERCYREAVRLRPADPDCVRLLGDALAGQGKVDEAAGQFRQALRLRPGDAATQHHLGAALLERGDLPEALAALREAVRLRPADLTMHSALLCALNYDPGLDTAALFAEHRRWGELHGKAPAPPPHANGRDPARRLRVGYVSPDLCRHPVARFLEPILAHHDRAAVEAVCYADVAVEDAVTARLRSMAAGWRSTRGVPDDQLAALVRADGIDVLVDLAGHTAGNRLRVFAARPVPVQVSYLGYPNTTGLAAVDYRLTDAVADPPGEPVGHTEELVRLPGGFCCYAPLEDTPATGPLPADRNGQLTFGSLHLPAKLNPAVLDLWAAVVGAVPSARLLIYRNSLTAAARERLLRHLTARGLAADRLDLRHAAPPGGHLAVYADVDVSLDAFPWGGHTTACESLWMGVPVLTLRGHRHAGRMVASVLHMAGLAQFVADTPAEYVTRAAALAADAGRLRELRRGLRDRLRAARLCDGWSFTRGLEAAYREMWRRWCDAVTS